MNSKENRNRIGLLVLFLMSVPAIALQAFNLQPIILELKPTGTESSGVFILSNQGEDPMAVELSLWNRELSDLGVEERSPADSELFILYPTNIILQPGARQTVRIQYRGPDVSIERAFRLQAEQLPVDFTGGQGPQGGRINIMYKYLAAVYVTPPNARSEVVMGSLVGTPEGGEDGLWVVVENIGSKHQLLRDLRITARFEDGETLEWSPEELPSLANENLLAGETVYYRLDLEDYASRGVPDVSFSISE